MMNEVIIDLLKFVAMLVGIGMALGFIGACIFAGAQLPPEMATMMGGA